MKQVQNSRFVCQKITKGLGANERGSHEEGELALSLARVITKQAVKLERDGRSYAEGATRSLAIIIRFQATIPAKTRLAHRKGRGFFKKTHPIAASIATNLANNRPTSGPTDMKRCTSGLTSTPPSLNVTVVVAKSANLRSV